MTKSKSRKLLEDRLRGQLKSLRINYEQMKQSRNSFKELYYKLKQQIKEKK